MYEQCRVDHPVYKRMIEDATANTACAMRAAFIRRGPSLHEFVYLNKLWSLFNVSDGHAA